MPTLTGYIIILNEPTANRAKAYGWAHTLPIALHQKRELEKVTGLRWKVRRLFNR